MARVLIVYESKYGQTQKIAQYIANKIRNTGIETDILEDHQKEIVGLAKYDGVIVGGAVYARGFPHKLQEWAHRHADVLNETTSAFFSVCLGILENTPKAKKEEREIVQGFFKKTGWCPQQWRIFAGGLKYSKYNWFIKNIMKRIAKQEGSDTDTARDYEYTNWQDVDEFVNDFLVALKTAPRHYEIPNRADTPSLGL
ncbi:flavodoxin domain-containing protein [Bdellovibrio sp. BCCA]|uniref:flavodoxin domain-containing protein n=1 Tax=Bdellovibrio sp. BCCA TaxID=3136281 RepID=UPI0030F13EC3